jgi:hypothetical protein
MCIIWTSSSAESADWHPISYLYYNSAEWPLLMICVTRMYWRESESWLLRRIIWLYKREKYQRRRAAKCRGYSELWRSKAHFPDMRGRKAAVKGKCIAEEYKNIPPCLPAAILFPRRCEVDIKLTFWSLHIALLPANCTTYTLIIAV